jgi:hypothetical protein
MSCLSLAILDHNLAYPSLATHRGNSLLRSDLSKLRFPYRLPWVPDLVGYDWQKRDALLIVESAYATFIGGDRRQHEIAPDLYASESCEQFGKVFFDKLIGGQRLYYRRVSKLASAVIKSCRLLALFDLCRVALVRRADECDKGVMELPNAPQSFLHNTSNHRNRTNGFGDA